MAHIDSGREIITFLASPTEPCSGRRDLSVENYPIAKIEKFWKVSIRTHSLYRLHILHINLHVLRGNSDEITRIDESTSNRKNNTAIIYLFYQLLKLITQS